MPDEIAYPTWVGLAMLRDIGIGKGQADIRNFRSQEAVGYAVEQKLSDVGVVISYSKVAKDWTSKGHRFLWESKKLPFWSVIGSPKLTQEEIAKIREALIKLDQGRTDKNPERDWRQRLCPRRPSGLPGYAEVGGLLIET